MITNCLEPLNEDKKTTLTSCHEHLLERVGLCKYLIAKFARRAGESPGNEPILGEFNFTAPDLSGQSDAGARV